MKIALFAPYCSQNHGTVLQAFALSKAIELLGHSCEYIDWCYYKLTKWERIKFLLRHPLYIYYFRKNQKKNSKDLSYSFLNVGEYVTILSKNKLFCKKYTPHTGYTYALDELYQIENLYDKIVVGSDQTWSPNALYQYSPYYLSFVRDSSKKVSYACSLGTMNLPNSFIAFLKKKLTSFNKLSCREQTNTALLRGLLRKDVLCVLDPTLLFGKDIWSKYFLPVNNMPTKYILCYILGEKSIISEYAELLSKKKRLPVFYILTRPVYEKKTNVLSKVGCQEFLWLIANCEILVTDSFHGTIFALNFGRNFISFDKHPSNNSFDNGRLLEVLTDFKLESHYHLDEDQSMPIDIDYEQINDLLKTKRQQSLAYLKSIL